MLALRYLDILLQGLKYYRIGYHYTIGGRETNVADVDPFGSLLQILKAPTER